MPWLLRSLFSTASVRGYSTAARHAPVVLRPYQESCLETCIDALKAGSTRIGISLPTGSGKTTVFISLLSRLPPPAQAPEATRSLVIVNSVELALQTADQAKRLFPEWSVEIEQGKHSATGTADLTVATFQTLLRSQRLEKFRAEYMKALIVDEAHHAAAPSYRRILSRFHPDIKSPDNDAIPPTLSHHVPILGFSATFSRHDGLALGSVFERIVYHRDFLDMIKEQWLCNVRFTTVRANIDLSRVTVNSRTGEFNPTSLSHVINTDAVNELVVRTWLDKAADRKSTLVFCVNVAHIVALTAAFREAGIDARYLHATTPAAERKALVEAFKAGRFPVLVNCAVLTEGADIPNIDCVLVARPTRSRNIFAQMIGRGMRLSPGTGKEDCQIIDFVDSQERVAGVISAPTLFGLDPSEVCDDETVESLEQRSASFRENDAEGDDAPRSNTSQVPEPKSVTYIDYDDPFALVDHASGDPNIYKLSRNAWVCCGGGLYVLECLGKGYLRVERVEEAEDGAQFKAHYTPPTLSPVTARILKISPYRRSKLILTAQTLAEAVKGCDTYARTKVLPGNIALGLLRTAKWRREQASTTQRAFVMKRWKARKSGISAGDYAEDGETHAPGGLEKFVQRLAAAESNSGRLPGLTKGEAANIITRLKHGAQARYERRQRELAKAALAASKVATRKMRETVKVGALPA